MSAGWWSKERMLTGFDLSRGRGDHITQLIGHSREGRPESGGRNFRQQNRNNTPRSKKDEGIRTPMPHEMSSPDLPLNTKLDTEGTRGKLAECIRENPEGNECSNKEDENAERI